MTQIITFIINNYILKMSLITDLATLTEKIYQLDISRNLYTHENDVVFYSDNYFDWYAEGVFVYQPQIEGDKGVKYIDVGLSDIYEFDESNESAHIYMRSDYFNLISRYYDNYCAVDIEHKNQKSNEYIYTDFVITQC